MLENCSELKRPCVSPSNTIIGSGVAGVTSEYRQMVAPAITVFTIRTGRKPKRRRILELKTFMPMAAAAAGIISSPDSHAGSPRPS